MQHTALAQHGRQLFEHLRTRYAEDRRTPSVLWVWNEMSVQRSAQRNYVAFLERTLIVGTWCSTRDTPARWRTRLIYALAKAATTEDLCKGYMAWLLNIATNDLGWQCEVDCDACYETGVCAEADCPKCVWKLEECAKNNKFVWPELIGRPAWLAALILKTLQPTKRVVLDTWDTLYHTPGNPNTIRIVYDSRTGVVVAPAPYNTASPEILGPREACFLSPAGLCLGAPPNPPPAEWKVLIGQRVGTAIAWLKARYPHAVIEPVPSNALKDRMWRHDRIRLRYNSETMEVVGMPTVG